MNAAIRRYDHAFDYERVNRFLVSTYAHSGAHINWLQPRWEYMHFHPLINRIDLSCIGIREEGGEISGLVHPEHSMSQIYLEFRSGQSALASDLISHAEAQMGGEVDGVKSLGFFVNERNVTLGNLLSARGYAPGTEHETMSCFEIPDHFPEIPLREGFRLATLADDNDLAKLHRVLWRGFGHGDEAPAAGIADRRFMQSAPNYRLELNVVVIAPSGEFASYCGMWFEPVHRVAYVEPVATDPGYRRLGLGKAAVLEGIRRCAELGAKLAYVGADLPLYLAIGFRRAYRSTLWQRSSP